MNNQTLLISFLFLLAGIYIFRRLWLGALGAVIILLISKIFFLADCDSVYFELANAFVIWIELILLIFGAYLFYYTLSCNNHFISFTENISTISSRISVVIILCFFMGSFMEGIAGFGIPALLIAPLMLTVGFKPFTSVLLPLTTNTIAVLFGALGTPLKIGLGINSPNEVVIITLLLNALPTLFMPFILAYLLSKTEQLKIFWKKEWKLLLGAGVCFYVSFSLTGIFSIEFPSVVAGVLGVFLFGLLFIPTKEKISGQIWRTTFSPYLFLITLLLAWKFISQDIQFSFWSNIKTISLYQPGLIFINTSVFLVLFFNSRKFTSQLFSLVKATSFKIRIPAITILLLICFTQLIADSLSENIGAITATLNKSWQLVLYPLIGIAGSFFTGRATMSNLLFAESLSAMPLAQKTLFTALLHSGSAFGNAISLQNIVMVKSVTSEKIPETKFIKYNLSVIIFYTILITLSALVYRQCMVD